MKSFTLSIISENELSSINSKSPLRKIDIGPNRASFWLMEGKAERYFYVISGEEISAKDLSEALKGIAESGN